MPTITADLLTVSLADAITGWSGSSGQLDTEVYKQAATIGTDGAYTYQTGKNTIEACTFTPATNINMTANYTTPHLYWTMRCDVFPFCEDLNTGATNSGLMVRVTDGSGNYKQWHIAGADTWDGSWQNFVLDLTSTASHSSSGTLSLADVDIITWYTDNSNSGNIRIIDNTWLDAVRYGDGLQAESATTEAFGFTDIADDDSLTANWYGVMQEYGGVLFPQGGIVIGDSAGSANANFVSLNETVYFQDRPVSGSHYIVEFVQGTGNTDIDIDGLVMKTVGTTGAEFNIGSDAINSCTIDGSTFIDMGTITINKGTISTTKFSGCGINNSGLGVTYDNCTWDLCDAIQINGGAEVTNSLINKSTATSAMVSGTSNTNARVTGNTFVSDGTGHAVNLGLVSTTTSMTWDNTLSGYVAGTTGSPVTTGTSGNEALLCNVASGQTLTINVAAGATIPSVKNDGTGSVNVVSGGVTIDVNVKDNANPPVAIESALVYIDDDLGAAGNIANVSTDASGDITQQSYNGAATSATLRVRKYGYKPFVGTISLEVDTATNVNLTPDPQQT